ncbi:IclR family transcriptional regulator [Actinocorallia herbida]|uniref:IclR family transcriptional regulator n=1 Tax=Actinocorallia herbida TaxID=58109 RepID=A0A3N1CZG6_9ACTN|nr:IclR family transcriptional regulator [Actinocorallia herbida]ROO86626.1 IclR family transcriptional regulator [Actinocorallia herbida]
MNEAKAPGVAAKVMGILDAFAPGDPALTLTEICRRTGLPLATGHRLIGELVAGGFLERRRDGSYRVGLRLWQIAAQASAATVLRELALPFMQDLYEATHENVQLAIVREGRALYLERIRGPRSVPIVSRVGTELPLHATGVGKIFLAFGPAELLERAIGDGLGALTRQTITDPARLRAELAEVRREGFAVTREEMTLGSCSVAAPVRDARGGVVAALSLVARSGAVDVRRLAPVVVAEARALSRDIATRGNPEILAEPSFR